MLEFAAARRISLSLGDHNAVGATVHQLLFSLEEVEKMPRIGEVL
jgi:hypothetical protein